MTFKAKTKIKMRFCHLWIFLHHYSTAGSFCWAWCSILPDSASDQSDSGQVATLSPDYLVIRGVYRSDLTAPETMILLIRPNMFDILDLFWKKEMLNFLENRQTGQFLHRQAQPSAYFLLDTKVFVMLQQLFAQDCISSPWEHTIVRFPP